MKKPDFIAYSVEEGKDGQAYFNKIGAAWAHRDGQGYDLNMSATPVNGRVSLRMMRDERMADYRQQETQQQEPTPQPSSRRSHGYESR